MQPLAHTFVQLSRDPSTLFYIQVRARSPNRNRSARIPRYHGGVSQTEIDRSPGDPLSSACLLWVVGLLLATLLPLGCALVVTVSAAAIAGTRRFPHRWALALLPLAVLRFTACESLRPPDVLREWTGRHVICRGVVAEPEVVAVRFCRFVLEVREAACGAELRTVRARILVIIPWRGSTRSPREAVGSRGLGAPVHWGQEVCVAGRLEAPHSSTSGFDFEGWLAERDIYQVVRVENAAAVTACGPGLLSPPRPQAAAVRRFMESTYERELPQPHASLLRGVVLAEARGLPDEIAEAFRATGTYHVLVTAGIHVNFVMAISMAVLGTCGVGGGRAALATIPVMVFYAFVAGSSPSIVRASIMGSLALLGHALGRPSGGPCGLAAAVLVMTAWNPRLLHDAGFQMSVACVHGILHFTPILEPRLRRLPARLRGAMSVTIATQLMIAPLCAVYFGRVSVAGVVANLAVVPLCEVLLTLGLALSGSSGIGAAVRAAGFSDVPFQVVTHVLATASWAVASLVLHTVAAMRCLPACDVQVSPPGVGEVVTWYTILWGSMKLLRRARVPDKRRPIRGEPG